MSKMKDLSMILDNMIECGNRLIETANALKDFYSSTEDEKEVATPVAKPKEAVAPATEPEKAYTLEEVRAILSAKSKAGFREQVKEMITKRGVDNLTKLDPSEYPSLVKEVEGLTNG